MNFNFEFDEQKVFDAVVSQFTRYMIEKQSGEIKGVVAKDVAQQIKSDFVDSGLIEKRVEEVVKRVENSLMARVNKQFTPVLDSAVEQSVNAMEKKNQAEPHYKVTGEGRQVRDLMIATIIGFQNEMGNDESSPAYQAYQKMLVYIEETFGPMMS